MPELRPKRIREFAERFRVEPGRRVRLPDDFDPDELRHDARGIDAKEFLEQGVELLAEYQARLAAQDTYSVLVILQAMDAAGKDGTIKHVMSGVNPQGVEVSSFKVPSPEELDHDYMWRYMKRLPARGNIGIFNRSYYEEVLVVRVHPQILAGQKMPVKSKGKDVWERRFREINSWERYLTDQGYRIVKLFLNVSKDEQRQRFLSRIDEPDKNWKFSAADAKERAFWDDYQKAFSDVLSSTSTGWAPWHVIPADDKPLARLAAAAVIADALIAIDPQYPTLDASARQALAEAKIALEAEAPAEGHDDDRAPAGANAGKAASVDKPGKDAKRAQADRAADGGGKADDGKRRKGRK